MLDQNGFSTVRWAKDQRALAVADCGTTRASAGRRPKKKPVWAEDFILPLTPMRYNALPHAGTPEQNLDSGDFTQACGAAAQQIPRVHNGPKSFRVASDVRVIAARRLPECRLDLVVG